MLLQPTRVYRKPECQGRVWPSKAPCLLFHEDKEQLRHTLAAGHLPGRDCSMVARIRHVVLKRADQLLPLSDDEPELSQVGSASKLEILPDLWAQLQLFLQFAHKQSHSTTPKMLTIRR